MEKQIKQDSAFIMQYLEEAFPNKLPLSFITENELAFLLGQQDVINKLKIKLNIDSDELTENKIK